MILEPVVSGGNVSYYQEGYDKGYEDGLAGEPARLPFLDFLNTEDMTEWESGYDDGHAAGTQEHREQGEDE